MEMDIDIQGIEQLYKAMVQALPGLLAERVQGDGLVAAARVVRNTARASVPVRTGALQRSIKVRRRSQWVYTSGGRKRVAGAAAQVVAGGRGARHAILVEYGTVRVPAQPYLEPGLLSTRSAQLAALRFGMQASFVKIGRQLQTGQTTALVRRLAAE